MTSTMTTDDGTTRARILQSTRAMLAAVEVGVLSARVGELPDGGEGLRAQLEITVPEGREIVLLEIGDEVSLGDHGVLQLAHIDPATPGAGGAEIAAADRAVVYLELRPARMSTTR